MTSRSRAVLSRCLLVMLATAWTLSSPAAHAQTSQSSRAEALFREGKELLNQHDYTRACPLLAASFDLDPGTGVLLALAICHEGEGKLASASAEYEEVASRAKAEGRADRARVARERDAALAPRLSTLSIVPAAEIRALPGLSIHRNGVLVPASAWDKPTPLDGGQYLIEVVAQDKKPWRASITLKPSGDAQTVAIPALEAIPSAPPRPAAGPAEADRAPSPAAVRASTDRARPLRTVGFVSLGAGAVGLGVGAFFGLRAMSKNDDSNADCDGDVCGAQGKQDRNDARSAGNVSTIAFLAGGVLAATGGALLLFEGKDETGPERAASAGVMVEPDRAQIIFHGRF